MLLQAASGGGKSYALRRIIEQCAGKVQIIVIDREGEFASLREKHDFIIAAAKDGDALAHPKTAALLARKLLETGVSAVLDIYELKKHEQIMFVKLFLDSMVSAPKNLWHPVLVILDEAHLFAPEKGSAESLQSVIDLSTLGRKRGFGLIAATQRIAKFNKDAAADLLNKMVGLTGLDIDVKRAAEDLGFTTKESVQSLKHLEAGEFFIVGPAFSREVVKVRTGPVHTTHPKPGSRQILVPPKPTAAILKVLPQLADLPKEAEQQAKSLEDLRKDNAQLKRELHMAQHASSAPIIDKAALDKEYQRGRSHGYKECGKLTAQMLRDKAREAEGVLREAAKSLNTAATKIAMVEILQPLAPADGVVLNAAAHPAGNSPVPRLLNPRSLERTEIPLSVGEKFSAPGLQSLQGQLNAVVKRAYSDKPMPPTVRKILDTIHKAYPVFISFDAAARRAGVSKASSAYRSYRKSVQESGEVELERDGYRSLPEFANATISAGDSVNEWVRRLPPSAGKMLQAIYESPGMTKDSVAEAAGISKTSSGLGSGLSDLKKLDLIEEHDGGYRITEGLR